MKKRMMVCVCAVLAVAGVMNAADDAWKFTVTPYVWGMGMDGDVGLGPVSAPVDVKFLDAIKDLDLAGMVAAEMNNGTLGVLFDGSYVKLSEEGDAGRLSVELEQWSLQGGGVYRVMKSDKTTIDVGVGARYVGLDVDIDAQHAGASSTKEWADPLFVVRVRQQFTTEFSAVLVGDIGGFGVSSDLTWQLTGAVGYSFTPNATMLLGYRYLDYDYENDGFKYDLAQSGLAIGLQISMP